MSKTFLRHVAEVDAGFYSPTCIRGLKHALNRLDRVERGLSVGRSFSSMTASEITTLCKRIEKDHPRIVSPQAEKGLAWLRKQYRTPKGTERKNNPFSSREAKILDSFDHFEIISWWNTNEDNYGYPANYIPVYRVVATDGSHFDYYAGSWQSNVPLTIVG